MTTARRGFEDTRWTLVLRAGGAPTKDSREALEALCRAYRAPLLAFARRFEADPERAEDLIQGFLARVVEKDVIGAATQSRGRFRSFLSASLRNYALNVRAAEATATRGGRVRFVDVDSVELASEALSADRRLDRLWARTLLDRALARLTEEQARGGRGARLEALRERLTGDDDGATLAEVAKKLEMSEGAVRVKLFQLRRRFADLVRAEVADTVAELEDVDAELAELIEALRDSS